MAGNSNDSLNSYLPDGKIYKLAHNASQEMPGHVPMQDSLGQIVQRHQEQLPAQALPQQWNDERAASVTRTNPSYSGKQSSVGSHQPGYIPPCLENLYASPLQGVCLQHSESTPRTYVQEQHLQPQKLQLQDKKQPRIPQFDGPQSFETTGRPNHMLNVTSQSLKRKATDHAEDFGRSPSNTELLQKRKLPYFPSSETDRERQSQPYPMPSDSVRPPVPVSLNIRRIISHSRPEIEQPALEAPPEDPPRKAIAPKPDLSAFSCKPQSPTDGNFLRDRGGLVQPFNEEDASMKTSYDPETIARDILIASGSHPTEPCLNHHLMHLRGMFIDTNSDLDTFRWDIVDAPGMQVQRSKPVKNHVFPATLSAPNRGPASHLLQPSQPVQQPIQQPVQQPSPTNQEPFTVTSHDHDFKNTAFPSGAGLCLPARR